MICACTGAFGTTIAPAGKVIDAWAKNLNATGGINGHPVQLMTADDASTPGTSVSKAQQMIDAKVDVIIDETILDSAWADTVSKAGIPVVGGNFSGAPYYTNPLFFASGQTNDSITYSNVATAKQAGATNIGIVYCAEAPQCQESVDPTKTVGQQLGVPVVYSGSISATAPNYTAQCIAAQQAKVSGLLILASGQIVAKMAADCNRQGYNPIYLTEGTGYNNSIASSQGLKDNTWSPFPILPYYVDQPQVQQMNTVIDKYYPGLRTDPTAWSVFATQAWTGGLLLQAGVKASGMTATDTPSSSTIIKGLTSLKGETLSGWSPPLTFVAGQANPVKCWFTSHISNGTPALANNGQLTCQK
jgi:branched-chain amino acid transport system substrate-binding protein